MSGAERVSKAVAAVLECGEITVNTANDAILTAYTFEPWESQEKWWRKAIEVAELAKIQEWWPDWEMCLFTTHGLRSWPEPTKES